jgi:hypothetical protein
LPAVTEAMRALPARSVTLDGEAVICGSDGRSQFERMRGVRPPWRAESLLSHRPFHQRETVSQTPGFPFRAGESADGGAEVSAVAVAGGGGEAEVAAVVVAGGEDDEADGVAEVSAAIVAGGEGDDADGGAEVAAVVVAGFTFVRAAGGFMTAGANRWSSAITGSGVMTVVGALPASPVCMELDSFTAMRTGTLCG